MNCTNRLILIFPLIVFSCVGKTTVYFSPDDKPQKHLVSLLRAAKTKIHAAVYMLTDMTVAQELIDAKRKRSVDVQLVTDQTCLESSHAKISLLKPYNIDLFIFPSVKKRSSGHVGSHGIMHHKFAIIDNVVWTGSFNWTKSAAFRNQENVIVCDDAHVVQRYEQQFEHLKRRCVAKKKRPAPRAVEKTTFSRLTNLLGRIRRRWGH